VSEEHADRILEAGLEEVLGGQYPPDLTPAILQAWEARQQAAARAVRISADAAASPLAASPLAAAVLPIAPLELPLAEPAAPPRASEGLVRVQSGRRGRRPRHSRQLGWIAAASFLAVAGLCGFYAAQHWNPPGGRTIAKSAFDAPGGGEFDTLPDLPAMPQPRPRNEAKPTSPASQVGQPPAPSQLAVRPNHEPQADLDKLAPSPASAQNAPPRRQPSADADVIAFIDDALQQKWQDHSVTPAPPMSDEQWCDRLYRRLAGRQPTSDEVKQFLRQQKQDPAYRRALVDQLLASDDHARSWAELWAAALLGPAGAGASREAFSRDELIRWLSEAVRTGKTQDQVAGELLTATGSQQPGAEDYNGAVNFLLAGVQDHGTPATDRTSRVFLGKQLICTSCHAHPTSGWEQGEFWELNAFFRQLAVQRDHPTSRIVVADRDFFGASGAAKDAELFYRLPDGRLGMAYPAFNGQEVPHSGLVSDVHRRRELAKLVTASEDFRLATVNRIWSWLFGYGFTQPIDDMGPHNPASHPELLARLAEELAAHDFDTRRLVRWIVLSEPFGLSGKRTPESWMDTPESGGQPLFARDYGRDQRQDAIADGSGGGHRGTSDVSRMLVQVVHQRPTASSSAATGGTMARRSSLSPRLQSLDIIETQPDSQWPGPAWLPRLAHSQLPAEKKIEHVFLSVLDRRPSGRELTAAKLVLADRLGNPAAIREIWQTLLASQAATNSGQLATAD
jgi:hypothetical protein